MLLVSDKLFLETLKKINIKINPNPKQYSKKVLINLMPTFALKQLIIFIKLGEYLKTQNFFVDYFVCNSFFNHCDMIKMNDGIDRKLMCERCQKVEKTLDLKFFKKVNPNNKIIQNYEIFLENAVKRFCGKDIKCKFYEKECEENLKISSKLTLDYDFFISLNHFQNYSIGPLFEKFKDKMLIIGLQQDKLYMFANNKELIFNQNIQISFKDIIKVKEFFSNRIKIQNNFQIQTSKKIITIFPNVLEDSFFNSNGYIFKSMYEWLIETIEFLLKNDFFVIIKSHPAEKNWNPMTKTIDYFTKQDNLLLIENEFNAYDLMDKSDYVVTYNGTIFFEALVMNKKVVLGGQIGNIYHNTKEEYFNQFICYKSYDFNKSMEYACKLYFYKTFKLKMIDDKLVYPHIKQDVNDIEIAFKAIKDVVLGLYNPNKYKKHFISTY